ncbi:exodeoxyribonuclease VII large subunit [Salisediminibacterium halotolerans]|uniref:exodeoxyribonuclease VII large subunit n=1 Tax=Salisediminibacterium halotolerans TaxID=517425 RepID=UPI000EAC6641|nr:exodeoxyribonuclease VII large subunit [Salisediminibacterium halotolerans]RLJ78074.1 exodeoxyribonuclease VII large subunit [Actinophytocola xinjiangensis]RPE88588.1 exodeoxyribonuclease VII large subunit [Salisediminibacterium halotolerans]TWG37051.1 exodeoxyribonuclease VII large subunit [Salisediminibacterium halotolerans]GEL06905.1 exodeoxyribonuclease 7 large subunit [Salisediminibacterium halotolerans]
MTPDFWTVSQLNYKVKYLLDTETSLQNVWLRAEISNFKHHSRGHMYFTLKDGKARVSSVMFAGNNRYMKFRPEDGMNVLVRGSVSVYEPYGQYQLYVKEMQPDGIGNLYLAYEKLKEKLEKKGYFLEEHKKAIPKMPASIAVITSPTGAAVRDIITTLTRRYPLAKVTLLPVAVQGEAAVSSIANAIHQANSAGRFDVIITGRGGGSLEELWAFNEEAVADAIYTSSVPVISAVGHESDVTISDFVADLRAPTPTAAAELAVPSKEELTQFLYDRTERLKRAMTSQLETGKERLNTLSSAYAFRYPKQLIEQKEQDLDRLYETLVREVKRTVSAENERLLQFDKRLQQLHPAAKIQEERDRLIRNQENLQRQINDHLKEKKHLLAMQMSKLDLLSPLKLMERGYSLVYNDNNELVKSTSAAPDNSNIRIEVQDGQLYCRVYQRESANRLGLRSDNDDR